MKKYFIRLTKWLLALFVLLNIIVICHAYKFTHFYDRGEASIVPKAQQSGWYKTKELLFGFNAEKQLNSQPDSSFTDLYFTTKEGIKLSAWEMKAANPRGTVALFHGHGSKKSSLLPEAAALRNLGFNTILRDFRAHGSSEGNNCTIGYKEAEDVKLVYDHIKAAGEKNIVLYGVSLGAATITRAISIYQLTPSGVILDMPFAKLSGAVTGRLKLMGVPAQPLGSLLGFWGGTMNGFWAFNHNPCQYVRDIQCPVLLQRGELDTRVTQAETDLIYKNIPSNKKMVIYSTAGHESLYKKENSKWVAEVTAFLQ
jgi:alpha-beta hydrolase superfamily lysophospholipase